MKLFIFPATPVDTTGLATQAEQQLQTAQLVAINANTDTLESLITVSNTKLTNIDTNTDNIEADLVVIAGYVDQIETNQASQSSILTTIATNTSNTNNQVGYLSPKLDTLSQKARLKISDMSLLIDAAVTPIPTSGALTLVASTSSNIYQIQSIDDIGAYMAICVGAPGFEAPIAALPLGGGLVDVYVAQGDRISVKSLIGSNITNGNLIINALGLGQP
jgi:hypothetical protein